MIHLLYIMKNLLKSDSHLPKKICIICLIESPLELMKNAFYFILKALFVFTIFTTFWSCSKNRLIRKIRLTSKFMKSQPGLQRIRIYILPNILQSKATKQWNFVNYYNITREIFFFRNYVESEAGRLVTDLLF